MLRTTVELACKSSCTELNYFVWTMDCILPVEMLELAMWRVRVTEHPLCLYYIPNLGVLNLSNIDFFHLDYDYHIISLAGRLTVSCLVSDVEGQKQAETLFSILRFGWTDWRRRQRRQIPYSPRPHTQMSWSKRLTSVDFPREGDFYTWRTRLDVSRFSDEE